MYITYMIGDNRQLFTTKPMCDMRKQNVFKSYPIDWPPNTDLLKKNYPKIFTLLHYKIS